VTINPDGMSKSLRSLPSETIAHLLGGKEARLARIGIREHEGLLSHAMRGPPGTGRGGVQMAGGRQGQGAEGKEAVACHHCYVLFKDLLMSFYILSRLCSLLGAKSVNIALETPRIPLLLDF